MKAKIMAASTDLNKQTDPKNYRTFRSYLDTTVETNIVIIEFKL